MKHGAARRLFREAARAGLNEAALVDVLAPRADGRARAARAVLLALSTLLILGGLALFPVPVIHAVQARVVSSPEPVAVSLREGGVIRDVEVELGSVVARGDALATVIRDAVAHPDLSTSRRSELLGNRVAALEAQRRLVRDARRELEARSAEAGRLLGRSDATQRERTAASARVISVLTDLERRAATLAAQGIVTERAAAMEQVARYRAQIDRLAASASRDASRSSLLDLEAALARAVLGLQASERDHAHEIEQLELERARLGDLGGSVLRSPVDGRVISLAPSPGKAISPGEPLFLVAPSGAELMLRAEVSPDIAAATRPGMAIGVLGRFGGRWRSSREELVSVSTLPADPRRSVLMIGFTPAADSQLTRADALVGNEVRIFVPLRRLRLIDLFVGG